MCINVACSADIAVSQPLLNFLQAYPVGIKQAGAAMAQVVETNTLHLVCDQKIWEMLTQKVGPNPLSHRVYIKNTAWSADIQKMQTAEGFPLLLKPPYGTMVSFHLSFFQNFD